MSQLLSTIDSVYLSVCHKLQIASSFLFIDGIEPFFCQFSMTPSTKLCSSVFDLVPITPKIYSPKLFLHKIAYKLACMADRPEMFGPTRGFLGMADSTKPCKMLWDRPFFTTALNFWLGAEIQSPTSFYAVSVIYSFKWFVMIQRSFKVIWLICLS